ncbi:VOC family protein [Salipiger mangrovisoli]|uniref:VOC family protein n=1 Tax=Salipiger mangrovisoli TaxID=2865933 RepID=A0ABR9WWN1_9RHOB|nr:VOC family protein [Salipiger mangrovisoli]MBE9635690.1 VOC family protein [Salipiger mangrovisoli]
MIVPALRYRDTEAMLAFLTGALGFRDHAVYRDAEGGILHAELKLGDGIIMFGPAAHNNDFGRLIVSPEAAGGVTGTIYVVVSNVAGHYARAVAAGAEVVLPLEEQPYGGQSYTVRDPEGQIWTFGEYHPEADHGETEEG